MTNAPATTTNIATTEMDKNEKSENDANCDSKDKNSSRTTKKRVTFRHTPETSDQCKVKRVYNPNFNGPLVSIIKKESLKYPILVYKSNCIVRPSRLTEIVKNSANIDKLNSLKFGRDYSSQHNSASDDKTSIPSSSSNVIVASKFNLPKLSVNSSRVIKPNKRFLYDTGDDAACNNKKKVIKASFWGAGGDQITAASTSKEKKTFGFNFVDELDLKSKKGKEHKESTSEQSKTSTSILRKPVLQLPSFGLFGSQDRDTSSIKSPFSLTLNASNTPIPASSIFTTSLVCHVCNSITTRKRPRKYGAVCCELCKKFMSRMIERVNKNPASSFQCDKGDGN